MGVARAKACTTAINIAKRMSHFQDSSVADREFLVRMWADVTPAGGLNHLHSHPGNLWAAVLDDMGYETEQESRNAGEIPGRSRFPMAAMRDTHFECGALMATSAYQTEIQLQRGNLILFPAWLRHGCGMEFEHIPEIENGLLSQ